MEPARNRLPANQQWTAPGKWPIVGEKTPRIDDSPWTISLIGLVNHCFSWTLEELRRFPQVERKLDLHCVTRWSMKDAQFRGVRLRDLLQSGWPTAAARFVSFGSRSVRNHSSSLPLDVVAQLDPIVALEFNGEPIDSQHGGPTRLIVPGKYLYKSVKWLERIELLAEDRLGYWEAEAGYHNGGDPWLEQRYLAGNLDRKQAAEILQNRELSGRDIVSLLAADLDLSGLSAVSAILRNADFRRSNLCGARFDKSNLSNAHFEGANLSRASFVEVDAEGANFQGADLRGANFTGCLLTGVTFCPIGEDNNDVKPAIIDQTTVLRIEAIEALMPEQRQFVAASLKTI